MKNKENFLEKLNEYIKVDLINDALNLCLEELEVYNDNYTILKVAELYMLLGQTDKLTEFIGTTNLDKIKDINPYINLYKDMYDVLIKNDLSLINKYEIELNDGLKNEEILNQEIEKNLKALTLKKLSWKNYEIKLKSVGSTNDYLKEKIGQGDKTKVVSAEEQIKGKGQRNHKFVSLKGGLYISIKLELNLKDIKYVTANIATICANAINKATNKTVDIKWLNDLYYYDKKVAGILCESKTDRNSNISYVIVGIGVNLIEDAKLPEEIKEIAISLMGKNPGISINDIIENIKYYLVPDILNIKNGIQVESLVKEYNEKLYKKGQKVILYNDNEENTGILLGIDDKINVLIATDNGVKAYSYGNYRLKFI